VFVPFHYGYWDDPERMRAANELTLYEWDPVSKQPYFKFAAVRLKVTNAPKTSQPTEGTPATASDFLESLARPNKNFTGITFLTDEMAAKRMEFLKEVAPNAKRVAVIFNPQHFDDEVTFARRGAESLNIELTTHPINSAARDDWRR
jgi:hypothetical protein